MTDSPWNLRKGLLLLQRGIIFRTRTPLHWSSPQLDPLSSVRERGNLLNRIMRLLTGRKIGILIAVFLAVISILMIFSLPVRENVSVLGVKEPELKGRLNEVQSNEPLMLPEDSDDDNMESHLEIGLLQGQKRLLSFAPPLPPEHPCVTFSLSPPPIGTRRRSGFRPCPVCYLPIEEAIAAKPLPGTSGEPIVLDLKYANEEHLSERRAKGRGLPPKFGGYPTWADRKQSFNVQESMTVHCGFVWGKKPGDGTGYDISEEDREAMDACGDIVVASAIFGAYDMLQQPVNIGEKAMREVCFFMFIDEVSYSDLQADGSIPQNGSTFVGLWRIVVIRNAPFTDPRRTGKIPKLLLHRLFPNVRFSIWMDAKLQLTVDPYQVLERFLWRGHSTWAISKHYQRFNVFEEAERNKEAGKYDNASIDAQIEVYRKEGLTPYSEEKLPIMSDVPEGCLIIREHSPLTNLFGCLWFNEVDRFTSRDQLSFGYTRDRLLLKVPWRQSMFLDCERRNFVTQGYHKPDLREKMAAASAIKPPVSSLETENKSAQKRHLLSLTTPERIDRRRRTS